LVHEFQLVIKDLGTPKFLYQGSKELRHLKLCKHMADTVMNTWSEYQ